jgi:hypothetical protein
MLSRQKKDKTFFTTKGTKNVEEARRLVFDFLSALRVFVVQKNF